MHKYYTFVNIKIDRTIFWSSKFNGLMKKFYFIFLFSIKKSIKQQSFYRSEGVGIDNLSTYHLEIRNIFKD